MHPEGGGVSGNVSQLNVTKPWVGFRSRRKTSLTGVGSFGTKAFRHLGRDDPRMNAYNMHVRVLDSEGSRPS